MGCLQLVWGPIGDRRGKYRVAAFASMATGVFTAAGSLAETMNWLVVARFFSGAMAAAIIPLAFAWIGDAFSFATRQAVLARFLSAQFTGIVLGQAAGGFIGDAFGWHSVFLIVGAIHVLAGACMLLELRLNPGAQPVAAPAMTGWRATVAAIGDLLASPWVRVMLGVVFVEAFAMHGAFAYIGADLHHRFGAGFGLVGVLLAVYGAGALTYSLSAKVLFQKLGERGLVIGGRPAPGAVLRPAGARALHCFRFAGHRLSGPRLLHAAQHAADQRHADGAADARHGRIDVRALPVPGTIAGCRPGGPHRRYLGRAAGLYRCRADPAACGRMVPPSLTLATRHGVTVAQRGCQRPPAMTDLSGTSAK